MGDEPGRACAVHQYVQATEASDGLVDHRLHLALVGYRSLICDSLAAQSSQRVGGGLGVGTRPRVVDDNGASAGPCEGLGNSAADASAASSDDCDSPSQIHRQKDNGCSSC